MMDEQALDLVHEPSTSTRRWRGWSRPQWMRAPVMLAGVILVFWLFVFLTVSYWAPYGVTDLSGPRFQPPSTAHWFGTDALGRDVFTRTMYGVRYSFPIAAIVIAAAVCIGSLLGATAAYFRGVADEGIMRLVDVTVAFPPMLLAMAVTAALGPGLRNAGIAMLIVSWPIYARLMRAQVLAVRELPHVEAARASGIGGARILFRHILPLCWSPIIVNATMDFGQIVLLAASLSFIGLGVVPPTPEWGAMISEGAVHFYRWWLAAGPGVAIFSVVLASNFLGDGLRDYLDVELRT